MNDTFLKIPYRLIKTKDNTIKKYKDDSLVYMLYVLSQLQLKNSYNIIYNKEILADRLERCKNTRTYAKINSVINILKQEELIQILHEGDSYSTCSIKDLYNLNEDFVMLYNSEIDIINKIPTKSGERFKTLNLYLLLKSFTHLQHPFCYPSYKTITDTLGYTTSSIKKYLNTLQENNLILCSNGGSLISPNGTTKNINNTYVVLKMVEDSNKSLEENNEPTRTPQEVLSNATYYFIKEKIAEGYRYIEDKITKQSLGGQVAQTKNQINKGVDMLDNLDKLNELQNNKVYDINDFINNEIKNPLSSFKTCIHQF